MNPLLRLYPASWRERYGDEMTEVLAARRVGLVAMLDLIRGALDAHRHPELVSAAVGADGRSRVLEPPAGTHDRGAGVTAFLGTFAAGLFIVAAASVAIQDLVPHIAWELTNAFAALAALVLGLGLLAAHRGNLVTRLAGVVLMAGVITVAWTGVVLPSVFTTVGGAILLAIGSTDRTAARIVGLLALAAAAMLAWSYWGDEALGGGLILALALYALVGVAVAWSELGQRRPILAGIGLTGLVALLVWVATTLTSPRILHDGYALGCGAVDRGACSEMVDILAAELRARYPGIRFTYAAVELPGDILICAHPVDDTPFWPCWNEAGQDAGGSVPG